MNSPHDNQDSSPTSPDDGSALGPLGLVTPGADAAKLPFELAPAPLLWRALAYGLDWLLAALALYAFLLWFVPEFYPAEWTSLRNWTQELADGYRRFAAGGADASERLRELSDKVRRPPEAASELLAIGGLIYLFFFWFYFFATEFFTKGASFGKRICNLRVASTDTLLEPRALDSAMRAAWKSLFYCSGQPLFLLVGLADVCAALFNLPRLTWHDMLTRTVVLDATKSPLPDMEKRAPEPDDDDLDDIM